jgi:predicted metal-dependent phosphoesterase TrpH
LNVFAQFQQIHSPGRADLHLHTTCSDGELTPEEIVQQARRENLVALAITDHDTIDAIAPAQAALQPTDRLELLAGVEITCEYREREVHLLGYGFDSSNAELIETLRAIRLKRRERFEAMLKVLSNLGATIDAAEAGRLLDSGAALGRRHLAELLVKTRQVSALFYAFVKYLNRPEITAIPKGRLPVQEAIRVLHQAKGIASWAHPPSDCTREQIREWQGYGLDAVEVEYPWSNPSHGKRLREWARQSGLLITGGSDFHGSEPANRKVGSRGINREEFERIRRRIV